MDLVLLLVVSTDLRAVSESCVTTHTTTHVTTAGSNKNKITGVDVKHNTRYAKQALCSNGLCFLIFFFTSLWATASILVRSHDVLCIYMEAFTSLFVKLIVAVIMALE